MLDVFACVCASGLYKLQLGPSFVCALCEPGARCPGADKIEACAFNSFSVVGVVTECTPCAEHSRCSKSAPLTSPEQCQYVPAAEGSFDASCRLCASGTFQRLDLTFNCTNATENSVPNAGLNPLRPDSGCPLRAGTGLGGQDGLRADVDVR